MAKNRQPIAKHAKALGVSPAAMGSLFLAITVYPPFLIHDDVSGDGSRCAGWG